MERQTSDEYFMEIANVVAKRSTCKRRNVGAVIVRDKQILTTGYNGAPRGLRHCDESGCIREEKNVPSGERHELCRAVHAEQNAIIQAATHGVSIEGATIYVTTQPCSICAKMLINAGISKIVIETGYPDEIALEYINEAGVELVSMGEPIKTPKIHSNSNVSSLTLVDTGYTMEKEDLDKFITFMNEAFKIRVGIDDSCNPVIKFLNHEYIHHILNEKDAALFEERHVRFIEFMKYNMYLYSGGTVYMEIKNDLDKLLKKDCGHNITLVLLLGAANAVISEYEKGWNRSFKDIYFEMILGQ